MADALKQIADGFGSSLETAPFGSGSIWYFKRGHAAAHASVNQIPRGLHIGFGVGEISTHHRLLGGFETSRPVVTAFISPNDGVAFETRVGTGVIQSFGLHIGDLYADENDRCIDTIIAALAGKPMAVMGGEAARRLSGLRFPIDPWFGGDARELMFQARAMELVAVVAETLKDARKPAMQSVDVRRAEAVRDFIEAHLDQDLRLDRIADAIGVNARLLTTAFRRVFGVTVGEHILRRRMEEAARLFTRGASVKETASQIGYTPNALSAAFRRCFGYAPSHLWR